MLKWLNRDSISDADRAMAYDLLPDVDLNASNLDASCARIVQRSFDTAIRNERFLLINDGSLAPAGNSITLPRALADVWTTEQTSEAFDALARPSLSHEVTDKNRLKLVHWEAIDLVDKAQILKTLAQKHLPRPRTWQKLLRLWAFVAPEMTSRYNYLVGSGGFPENACIVPVQGREVLYAASEVVRLGERRLLQNESDWAFLSEHLLAMNQNWPRFVADARRATVGTHDLIEAEAANTVLGAVGLADASDVNKVMEQVAKDFFTPERVSLGDCVRIAQIAAKLGASASSQIRFVTQDGQLHRCQDVILFDRDGSLETLLSLNWGKAHLLHDQYSRSFTSCLSEDWIRWVSSGRSGLLQFVPLAQTKRTIYGRLAIEREIERLGGGNSEVTFPYRTTEFVIEDWDFDSPHWEHWEELSSGDPRVWMLILERVLQQPQEFWQKAKSARALQVATTRSVKPLTEASLMPTWLGKLRNIECLPDTRGFAHKPFELFRRTPETEPLMDIEPFVRAQIDTEAARPLLDLLGVRDTPIGPVRLMDRIIALAGSDRPPLNELEKWYRRLDQMVDLCSTDDLEIIRRSFYERKIIWTSHGTWARASGVFLVANEQEVLGAPTICEAVADLALWRKIGVAEHPTADLAIRWLRELPSGKVLSSDDARRVRALLSQHAVRVWSECGHWLNLSGSWVPISTLRFGLNMQTLIAWSHLHEWVKQGSADLRGLPEVVTEASPFSDLPRLSNCIQDRLHSDSRFVGGKEHKPWLLCLGFALQRIELPDQAERDRVRSVAARLAETIWQSASSIAVIPYVDGTPAGTSRRADAVWIDKCLYVEDRPAPKVALAVSQSLGSAFRQSEIIDAIKLCFDRPEEYVIAYLEENFTLAAEKVIENDHQDELEGMESSSKNGDMDYPNLSTEPSSEPDSEISAAIASGESPDEASAQEPDQEPAGRASETASRPDHARARVAKTSIIDRFASNRGFRKDDDSRFFHPDGSSISKSEGSRFWVRRNAAGDLIRYYWPRDHCLDLEPMQIDADVWDMVKKIPESYALILADAEGVPIEVMGSHVCALISDGELKVYPATYRLAYDRERAL